MSEGGAVKLTGFTDETMRMLVGYLPVHTTEQHANGDTVVVTLLAAENLKRLLTGLPDSAFPGGKWATVQHLEDRIAHVGDGS